MCHNDKLLLLLKLSVVQYCRTKKRTKETEWMVYDLLDERSSGIMGNSKVDDEMFLTRTRKVKS